MSHVQNKNKSEVDMADMKIEEDLKSSFLKLGIHEWLSNQCKAVGINKPSAIQHYCIPPILNGQDCIGCAKTGSGKTAAFALPIIQTLSDDPYGIYCLVITPTRELAFQIADQFRVLGKPMGLKDCVIIGGFDMVKQALELSRKPHIVIATPGRLADHLKSSDTFSLSKIKYLVLDEADRLLEGNFGPDLDVIFEAVPAKRQTLLFSATITDTMKELRKMSMSKPFFWRSKAEVATVEQLDQRYVLVPAQVKDAYLIHMLKGFQEEGHEKSVIIFTSTCKYCHMLSMMLRELGFPCASLHSMVKQRIRLASLAMFKSKQVRILVATDVASRGLDIPTVQVIINHNVPTSPTDYIHRVGRTARAGRGGMAITMVTQFDVKLIYAVEQRINTKLADFSIEESDVLPILNEVALAKSHAEMKLEELDFGERKDINKRKQQILDGKDPDEELAKEKKLRRKKRKAAASVYQKHQEANASSSTFRHKKSSPSTSTHNKRKSPAASTSKE